MNWVWNTSEDFEKWKEQLGLEIAEQAEKEIFDFYYGGDEESLEKQYYNPSTDFDFSNFIKEGDIEISVTPDSHDDLTKTQKALELNVGFKDSGVVGAKNKFTGYEISMSTVTNVSVDARPFTMADKTYEFTEKFNDPDEADDFAWKLFWMQTIIGNLEANLKHDVRFATDDRVSYFFMHLLVAIEELETYGTFDYVSLAREFIRAWQGNEKEAGEFLSLLSLSLEESNIEAAEESMDAAIFVGEVSRDIEAISNSIILASSYIDSSTVTKDGKGFEIFEVEKVELAPEGTVQHLNNAENTPKLDIILKGIETTRGLTAGAKEHVTSNTVYMLSVSGHFGPLEEEYSDVREEWEQAKNDFAFSKSKTADAREAYFFLNSSIEGQICDNPIAAMLWFGDSNQNVKGFKDIITKKHKETTELLNYYGELEKKIYFLDYESVKDSYGIDNNYRRSKEMLEDAKADLDAAKNAKDDYEMWMNKYDLCYNGGSNYVCSSNEDPNCYPRGICIDVVGKEKIECCKESKSGKETCWTCNTIIHYDCPCEDRYENNANIARDRYIKRMESAERNLESAYSEVSTLQTQIGAFFTDKGISGTYSMIDYPVLFSIYDGYYYHWNYTPCSVETPFPGRKYECANEMLVASLDVDKTNYHKKMPASPLTYDKIHEDENNYGLYYIKFMIDKMDETFGGSSISAEELGKAKEKLKDMKREGFFGKINAVLEPVIELVEVAGDINSGIAKIKNAGKEFPNSKEHFNTLLPRPPFPFDIPLVDFENQGFSLVHDIRLRANTEPGEIKIPFIKKPIPLGIDSDIESVSNPSFPIPYTPIFVYLWQFEVTPSFNKQDKKESSTLWLMDIENTQVAPLMEMKVGEYGVPVPFYLHKPTQYKYEFTPKQNFSKKIDMEKLPPVFVLAAGPFKTRFGPYMEPPDKKYTENPIPVDVSFDREFANDSARLEISFQEENIFTFTTITESTSLNNSNVFSLYTGKEKIISKDQVELLNEYGWSEDRADTYALKDAIFNKNFIQGEDNARVYFIDSNLDSIEVRLERGGQNLKVINGGNKRIDVSVTQNAADSCLFIFDKGNMSNNWIGSVESGSQVSLQVAPENNLAITAAVLIPEKVKDELERRGVPMTLKART